MNSYVLRVADLRNWPVERFRNVNLPSIFYDRSKSSGYKPTTDDQIMYYLIKSAHKEMRF